MNAGRLNKRVVIEKPVSGSPTADTFGEPIITWDTLAEVWAAVEPLTGREFWAQQQVQNEITVRFRVRYRSDIEAGMRVSYNSKYFVIKAVIDPLEKHEELQLMTAEGVRNG